MTVSKMIHVFKSSQAHPNESIPSTPFRTKHQKCPSGQSITITFSLPRLVSKQQNYLTKYRHDMLILFCEGSSVYAKLCYVKKKSFFEKDMDTKPTFNKSLLVNDMMPSKTITLAP